MTGLSKLHFTCREEISWGAGVGAGEKMFLRKNIMNFSKTKRKIYDTFVKTAFLLTQRNIVR